MIIVSGLENILTVKCPDCSFRGDLHKIFITKKHYWDKINEYDAWIDFRTDCSKRDRYICPNCCRVIEIDEHHKVNRSTFYKDFFENLDITEYFIKSELQVENAGLLIPALIVILKRFRNSYGDNDEMFWEPALNHLNNILNNIKNNIPVRGLNTAHSILTSYQENSDEKYCYICEGSHAPEDCPASG